MRGIADTGFLVAFANRNDQYHEWAVRLAEEVSEPLLTCEAVLAEAAFHLQSVELVLSMLEEGLIVLGFNAQEHLSHLAVLAKRSKTRSVALAEPSLLIRLIIRRRSQIPFNVSSS